MTSKDTPQTPTNDNAELELILMNFAGAVYLPASRHEGYKTADLDEAKRLLLAWRDHTQAQGTDTENHYRCSNDECTSETACGECKLAFAKDQGTDLATADSGAALSLSNPPKCPFGHRCSICNPAAPSSREGKLEKIIAKLLGTKAERLSSFPDAIIAKNSLSAWHTQQVEAAVYQARLAMLNALKNAKFDSLEQAINWLSVMADTLPAPQKENQ